MTVKQLINSLQAVPNKCLPVIIKNADSYKYSEYRKLEYKIILYSTVERAVCIGLITEVDWINNLEDEL